MRVNEFAKQFEELAASKFLESKGEDIFLPESYIKRISDCINYWLNNSQKDLAKKELNEFLGKPTIQNGTVYEILAYQWFHNYCIHMDYQQKICKEDSLKTKGEYRADGILDDEIVFDIKSFSFGQPQYNKLQDDLNKMRKEEQKRLKQQQKERNGDKDSDKDKEDNIPDYYIMISGDSNLSSKEMSELLKKKKDIYKTLFSEKNKNCADYIYRLSDYGLVIRAHYNKLGKVNIYTGISDLNVDKWAMLNETQVLSHCSQFCRNKPFLLIYPYDSKKAGNIFFDDQTLFYTFRTLMRRTFINLQHNEKYINSYDGKAVNNVKVSDAIRKLSGVFFLDVTNDYKYGKNNAILFVNPNAENPLKECQIEVFFRIHGVTICDFCYDNY